MFLAGAADNPGCLAARERLAGMYWRPLYSYLRRSGQSPADAEDITQGFFVHLIARNGFEMADPDSGRFRSFLLAALKRHVVSDWRRRNAAKRAPTEPASRDAAFAEEYYLSEPADERSPELVYDRRVAIELIDQAFASLRKQIQEAGLGEHYDILRSLMLRNSDESVKEAAARLQVGYEALRQKIVRLKHQFRLCFRSAVGNMVADPREVDDEIRYLITVVAD